MMSKGNVANPASLPGEVEAHISMNPVETHVYVRYVTVEFKTPGGCLLSLSIIKLFQ